VPDTELVHTCTTSAQVCPLVEAGSAPTRTRVVNNVRSLSVTSERLNARFATGWLTIANGWAGQLDGETGQLVYEVYEVKVTA